MLHLNVHIAALAGEVAEDAAEAMAAAVTGRLEKLKPVPTLLGKPRIYREGVVLLAEPADCFSAVHAEVVTGVAGTLGAGHVSNEPTLAPHQSLAYANTSAPTEPVVGALKPWLEPCTFPVTEVAARVAVAR